jgi:hypothetical protein
MSREKCLNALNKNIIAVILYLQVMTAKFMDFSLFIPFCQIFSCLDLAYKNKNKNKNNLFVSTIKNRFTI